MLIRIISVPEGEAPEEIRKDWVGVVLPVSRTSGLGPAGAFIRKGVESGQFISSANGYAVLTADAIRALELAGKTGAASYWKARKMLVATDELIFRQEEGQIIPKLELSEVQLHIEQSVLASQSNDVPVSLILRANHVLDQWFEVHGLTDRVPLTTGSEILKPFWGLLSAYGIALTKEQKENIVSSYNDD